MNLRYWITLPERILRVIAAMLGGLLYEITQVLLPDWVRRSRLYQALVYRLLRLTVELVGGVQSVMPPEEVSAKELAVRKAAGNVIELAGFLAVGWSPLWLLAAASDLTGGTRVYLNALVKELEVNGALPEGAEISSFAGLLNTLENTSGTMADMIDVPPMSLQEIRQSWQMLSRNVHSIPDSAQLAAIYEQLNSVAHQEGRSAASLSTLIAQGAVRAGVQMGSVYIFDYYQQALRAIAQEGWSAYARRSARPYLRAASDHLNPKKSTWTGQFLERSWRRAHQTENKPTKEES